MLKRKKGLVISGSKERSIVIDITYLENKKNKPIVVFSHGFKGFKDWGPFDEMATYFANNGFVFLKFNFSHNGTTLDSLLDFSDLEAFGNNNFSKELDDLGLVLNWLEETDLLSNEINLELISLFGHSRGGAISMLKVREDNRIYKLVSWASPADLFRSFPKGEKLDKWRETNVAYIYNGRTKQNMPIYFQFYEDCMKNTSRLNIEEAIKERSIPHLVVHGSDDPTVLINDAELIKSWNHNTSLHIIQGADHVFGSSHPYHQVYFPLHFKEAMDVTIDFLKN